MRVNAADVIVFDGQSLNLVPSATTSFPFKTMATGITHTHWHVAAVSGTTWLERTPRASVLVDKLWLTVPTSGVATLYDTGGTKNIANNMNAADTFAQAAAYWAARRSAGYGLIVASTLSPTSGFNAGQLSEMADFNDLLRAAVGTEIDALADLDTIPELVLPFPNTTYYPDGVHYSDAATTLIAPVTRAAYLAARATI